MSVGQGIFSKAYKDEKPEEIGKFKELIESENEDRIQEMIDSITSARPISPTISCSYNPQMAQVFTVENGYTDKTRTIYRIEISAERAIIDADNISGCGYSGEIFVLGLIYPNEISAVKIINDDGHSELNYDVQLTDEMFCSRRALEPDKKSQNRNVINPSNWLQL